MFRQETGVTISSFLRRARMDRAAELLRAGDANVTEAAMTVGYSSLSHFSKVFAETFGCAVHTCMGGKRKSYSQGKLVDRPRSRMKSTAAATQKIVNLLLRLRAISVI